MINFGFKALRFLKLSCVLSNRPAGKCGPGRPKDSPWADKKRSLAMRLFFKDLTVLSLQYCLTLVVPYCPCDNLGQSQAL